MTVAFYSLIVYKQEKTNWSSYFGIKCSIPKSKFVCNCKSKLVTLSPTFGSLQSNAIFHKLFIPFISFGDAFTKTSTEEGSRIEESFELNLYSLNYAPVTLL